MECLDWMRWLLRCTFLVQWMLFYFRTEHEIIFAMVTWSSWHKMTKSNWSKLSRTAGSLRQITEGSILKRCWTGLNWAVVAGGITGGKKKKRNHWITSESKRGGLLDPTQDSWTQKRHHADWNPSFRTPLICSYHCLQIICPKKKKKKLM